ncbi:MAG: transcription antitermination factor NusB [Clostridiales bacterium]|nr:transcription antitermination factor NusB [Clostridiales bacterium]
MGRKVARDILFKLVFENMFVEAEDTVTYDEFVNGETLDLDTGKVTISDISDENVEYLKTNYTTLLKNKTDILNVVAKYITGYTIDSMFKVDLAILVLAVSEMVYYKNTPVKVVVNEAVELAKKYSTEKSASFVNGILAVIIKELDIK